MHYIRQRISQRNGMSFLPLLFQNDHFLHLLSMFLDRIIEISYDIDCLEHVEFQHISSLECEALRYVAGYVCRKIQDQVKASSDGKKEAILLCLSELQKEMSVDNINNDEGHWIDRIDRGGLWHVNENTLLCSS